MAVFKCKMCGASLSIDGNQNIVTCEYCNTQQTIPVADNDKKLALFNRANNLRFKSEFDKAAGIYENIIAEFPDEAEAFWGLVLCKYGIEYVDDADGKKIPTCHRTLPASIMRDEDFQQACEYADIAAKKLYREEAKVIDGIQKKILEIAATEEPYDIFICYKETDDITGARTEDSSIAQDIYTAFTEMGYKVFYARNSLRRVAGSEYEPYIYAALSSAKIMLAIGTKYEYYDAVWVKNEWSRFISMMVEDSSKVIIPCFKDMDAYDIPEEFSNVQALDISDMMFFNSLETSVKRIRPIDNKANITENGTANNSAVDPLLKRAYIFLEDGMWSAAHDYCEKILDIDPENAQAYLCKLLADLQLHSKRELASYPHLFNDNINYQKIVKYADDRLRTEIITYLNAIHMAITEQKELKAKKRAEKIQLIKENRERANMYHGKIAAGWCTTATIKADGVVVACGNNYDGQCKVGGWHGVVSLDFGGDHLVGLKKDGTVVATGKNNSNQCDVYGWTDIAAVACGNEYTVGLKKDGTVITTPFVKRFLAMDYGEREVGYWRDIIAVSAGNRHTVGLRSDGTVVATGSNANGQCNVGDWHDVVAVSAGSDYTVALKVDGTVVVAGKIGSGSNGVISQWRGIIAISAGFKHVVGLVEDGTVVAVGNNKEGQCDVSKWTDVIGVCAGRLHTVGLKSDGTFICAGVTGDSTGLFKRLKIF